MDGNKSPFQCLICKYVFSSKYSLIRHNGRKHTVETLKNGATDTNHSATDTNHGSITITEEIDTTKPHCPVCQKDFSRNRYLKKHIEFCKGVINRLQCEYCEKEFKHENSRFRHYKTCATKKEMALIEKEAKYKTLLTIPVKRII